MKNGIRELVVRARKVILLDCKGICLPFPVVGMATRNGKELLVPLLQESAETTVQFEHSKKEKPLSRWMKPVAVVYSAFLCWQLTGMCLYVNRAVTCFKDNLLTYHCERNTSHPHSEELQFIWLVSRSLHIIIVIGVLQTCTDFCGYKRIMQQLKILPQFWSLVLLLVMALSRYVMMCVLSEQVVFHWHLVAAFALNNILRVAAVGVLNCTPLNVLWKQYPKIVFVFCKLTLLVIFIENLSSFLISLMQLTFKVEDFHREEIVDSSVIQLVYSLLYKFGTLFLNFEIMNFFWQKLFDDDKNVLSSHGSSHSILE